MPNHTQLHRGKSRPQAGVEKAAARSARATWCCFTGPHEFLGYVGCFSKDLGFADLLFEGYKFETLSLIPDQWDTTSRGFIETRENMAVNNYAQYCSVVKTGMGKAKMLIGGEVDACTLCCFLRRRPR